MSAKTKTSNSAITKSKQSSFGTMRLRSIKPLLPLLAAIAIVYLTFSQTQSYLWRMWFPLKTYENSSIGFRLDIPKSWKAKQAEAYQQVIFAPTKDDDVGHPDPGIIVARSQTASSAESHSAEEYFANLRATLDASFAESDQKTSLENYRRISQNQTSIDGNPALVVDIAIDNFTHRTDQRGKGKIAFIYIDQGRQYILTATSPDSDSAFLARLPSVIKSFRAL